MAAKLLHSLADDNPDLQKQIGCMTGIFQIFDRQQIVTPRRTGHTPKKLPPGSSHLNDGSSQFGTNNVPNKYASTENNSHKNVKEKQRVSTESSRASFSSSSRSSSFSSLDCNKAPQPETNSFDRIIFPETPSREPGIILPNASPQQAPDLRDVVKDSIYKEAQGLSVKTATREEATDSLQKPRSFPKPVQLLKTDDGSYNLGSGDGKQDLSVDLKESLRVLAKLRDAPWHGHEPRELSRSSSYHSRDGSSFFIAKDAPRFSYDGRDTHRSSFESRDSLKSPTLKQKELPRLSLDSREGSMRSFHSDSKYSSNPKTMQKESNISNDKVSSLQQPQGIQSRPPSVVAKLMGLETLPDSDPTRDNKIGLSPVEEDAAPFLKSSEIIRLSNLSKNLRKEPNSPRWKSPDPSMKPISRFPIEPAPWRQSDGTRGSQKPASRNMKSPLKNSGPFPSVYSEIEKRLKDLEFSQSGKDLRALKQILEAMQAKGLLETQKEGQDSNFMVKRDHDRKYTTLTQNTKLANQRNPQDGQVTASMRRGPTISVRNYDSPIVIMKPAKLIDKSVIHSSSVIALDSLPSLPTLQGGDLTDSTKVRGNSRTPKDQIPKILRDGDNALNSYDMKSSKKTLKSTQTFTRSLQVPKESSITSVKSSGSISPRLQNKKPELEKQSRPPTPPSDSSRSRRQSSRQQAESNSPGGRRRPKYSNSQLGRDQLSEASSQSRDLNSHDNEESVGLNGNIDPKADIEVTSSERSPQINSTPSKIPRHNSVCNLARKKSTVILSEDESTGEVTTETPEYPSPISVLDNALYKDYLPSPMKQIAKAPKGDKSQDCDRYSSTLQFSSADEVTRNIVGSGLTSDISRKKLQNIENLVEKLRRLNSSHDEARTDYIASLCENTNPDHRYISEVLLASGLLLRDLGSSLTAFQFHSSGHPLNPELFLVLEQTKTSTLTKQQYSMEEVTKEKFHRKLIFDSVNEILARKLVSVGLSSEPWLRPAKLARKTLNAQKLLRELCLEIDQVKIRVPECISLEDEDDDGLKNMLCTDVISCIESWTDYSNEVSGVVLDVERLIFKDLVDEVVIGESSGLRIRPVRRRQLFRK